MAGCMLDQDTEPPSFLPPQPSVCWVNPSQACWLAHWGRLGQKRQGLRLRQTPFDSWLYHHWLSGLGQLVDAPHQASVSLIYALRRVLLAPGTVSRIL